MGNIKAERVGRGGGDGEEKKIGYRENVSQHNVFMTSPQLTSCSREKAESFSFKIRNRTRMLTLTTFAQYSIGIPSQSN